LLAWLLKTTDNMLATRKGSNKERVLLVSSIVRSFGGRVFHIALVAVKEADDKFASSGRDVDPLVVEVSGVNKHLQEKKRTHGLSEIDACKDCPRATYLSLPKFDRFLKRSDVSTSSLILIAMRQHEVPGEIAPIVVHHDSSVFLFGAVSQNVRFLPASGLQFHGTRFAEHMRNNAVDRLADLMHELSDADDFAAWNIHLGVSV
jgi:hypothetical protein